jgi:hypothetical protein
MNKFCECGREISLRKRRCHNCNQRAWRLANPEKDRASHRRFKEKHKEKLRIRRIEFFQRNPDKMAEYNARHRAKYPEHLRDLHNQSNLRLRRLVIATYGGMCVCCGETQFEFLAFDHPRDDGKEHRRSIGIRGGTEFCRWLKKNGFPPIVQILCHNCNLAKAFHGECPHSKNLRVAS